MAGLIKEMLLDYGMDRLPFDQRIDILTAMQGLQCAGVLKTLDILLLNLYIAGYTSNEISGLIVPIPTEVIEETLERIMIAIEFASGYTDAALVHKIRTHKVYSEHKIKQLDTYLTQHSKSFGAHDI